MIGAIAGDIIGSIYEGHNIKTTDFPLFRPGCTFTDDTVLTVAIADAILSGAEYAPKLREWYRLYPDRGYGSGFRRWAKTASDQGDSMGNGSAMRVSPVGFAFNTLEEVLEESRKTALPSHNHPEAIKGAQSVASAIFLARTGITKDDIKTYIQHSFGYTLTRTLNDIRPHYRFNPTCPGSVPESITAFLESTDYEDAIRKAISLGGDSDTIACIAGGIAEAFYGIPDNIRIRALEKLDDKMAAVVDSFTGRYCSV